jgi:hypothetical protein
MDLGRCGLRMPSRLEAGAFAVTEPVPIGRPIRVIGTGEFMLFPQLLAYQLERAGYDVTVQSTTRAPVILADAVKDAQAFYWKSLLCWPTHMVRDEQDGRVVGIVLPKYDGHFFFQYGSFQNDMLGIRGKEKEGKWYASAHNRYKFLDERERGDWLSYVRIFVFVPYG